MRIWISKMSESWEEADWSNLENSVFQGRGQEIDHRYFEDIRKRLWLLEHIGAGYYTQRSAAPNHVEYYWIDHYTPGTGGDVLCYVGDLNVV